MKRIRWVTAALLGASLFALVACGGGSDESREPTEEEIEAAEDELARQEQIVAGAVEQAIADLEARIPAIDPCKADPAQLTSLYEPLGTLQAAGDLGDAYSDRVAEALAPVTRALARAYANKQLEGTGITGQDIVDWARGAGVDPEADDWMVDERCTERWRIEARWDGTVPPADANSVGHVDFSVYQGGPISVTAPLEATFTMDLPSDACQIDWVVVSEPLEVEGRWDFTPNAFIVDVTFGAQEATGTITCPGLGSLPPVTSSQGPSSLPVSLTAEDGHTQQIGGQLMPGMLSQFTFTVVRLD